MFASVSRPRTPGQKIKRKLYMFFRKLKWMIVTLMAPEYTLRKAIADRDSANYLRPHLEEWAREEGVD
jgi:hypothetical protein